MSGDCVRLGSTVYDIGELNETVDSVNLLKAIVKLVEKGEASVLISNLSVDLDFKLTRVVVLKFNDLERCADTEALEGDASGHIVPGGDLR